MNGEHNQECMRIRFTLHPEQNNVEQLQSQYGDRLVCVRYRYDERRQKRFKTVALIVEEREWRPSGGQWTNEHLVGVQIAVGEVGLRGPPQTSRRAVGRATVGVGDTLRAGGGLGCH